MPQELHIALIQTSLLWEDPEQNRTDFLEKINTISPDVDIIILPEMFTTGFTMTPENLKKDEGKKTLDWMLKVSKERNSALVGSLPFYENERYSNRLFFVEPNGNYHTYDKRHTFTLAGEDKVYSAGSRKLLVDYKGFSICPMVCYDLRFPVWSRNTENYDVLLYVANWPEPRIRAWDILLQARAIENMTYCVGVNRFGFDNAGYGYPGHSAVYDCLGKRLSYSESEEIIYTTLSKEHVVKMRDKLKFLEDRDDFTLLP